MSWPWRSRWRMFLSWRDTGRAWKANIPRNIRGPEKASICIHHGKVASRKQTEGFTEE